jgi:hypothetical protein
MAKDKEYVCMYVFHFFGENFMFTTLEIELCDVLRKQMKACPVLCIQRNADIALAWSYMHSSPPHTHFTRLSYLLPEQTSHCFYYK